MATIDGLRKRKFPDTDVGFSLKAKRTNKTSHGAKRTEKTSHGAKRTDKTSHGAKRTDKTSHGAKRTNKTSHRAKRKNKTSHGAKRTNKKSHGEFTNEYLYSFNAFPRCNSLPMAGYPLKLLKVRVLHEKGYTVVKNDFAVDEDVKDHKLCSVSDGVPIPCVNVCILQSGKDGILTATDKSILQYYKRNYPTEEVVFVIKEKVTDKQFCAVSNKIEEELKLMKGFNDVLHRLFSHHTDDICVRISLLLEQQLIAAVQSCSTVNTAEFKALNETDSRYHKLQIVSMRNESICEFGQEKDKLFVSIANKSKQLEVENYLKEFIQNADNVEVQEYKKMVVKNLSVKSGDRITSTTEDKKAAGIFGTVGLSLTDGSSHYCATCKHVIQDCLGLSHFSETFYDCNEVVIKTQEEHFETNQIFTPSINKDFSVVRLVRNDIPMSSSLRNQIGECVKGEVFGKYKDMAFLRPGTSLYKWGAKSGLTTGTFRRISEMTNNLKDYHITIDSVNPFADFGDSGSLICYSDKKSEIAVFILKGRVGDENDQTYYVYRLIDIMDLCKITLSNIRECLGH